MIHSKNQDTAVVVSHIFDGSLDHTVRLGFHNFHVFGSLVLFGRFDNDGNMIEAWYTWGRIGSHNQQKDDLECQIIYF